MTNVFDHMTASSNGELQSSSEDSPRSEQPVKSSRDSGAGVKELTQELLRYGYIEESRKRDFFRRVIIHEQAISAALDPLSLVLRLDTHRGIAFLRVSDEVVDNSEDVDAWKHPLVRRQRLTLEQSLLVAILRQIFVLHEQESGIGQSQAHIAVDDLLPQFLAYFQDSGSDAKNESRLLSLLDQLKTYGIVSEVNKKQEVTIRPLIAHLANPESLEALLGELKEQIAMENREEEGQ